MNGPALMGIVNVTPDSFSDGGRLGAAAVEHAHMLVRAGADILDLGAESTRPGATPVLPDEEWARLEPVLRALYEAPWAAHVRLSVDTRHAQTAARAMEFNVGIINDVGGLGDPAMGELLGEHDGDIVVMHALTVPPDKNVMWPADVSPVEEILRWKAEVTSRAKAFGIHHERLIYDPGIGFGKSPAQSRQLIDEAQSLVKSGGRWLVGHSRKSFLGEGDRDAATLACSEQLARAGITYLRVHDVAAHRAMLDKLCT